MSRHRRPFGWAPLIVTVLALGLAVLFVYSVNRALQDADNRWPTHHPSTSMHREGNR